MKKKSILGVVLSLVLLSSLIVGALPASADTLAWGTETIPGTTNNVLQTVAGRAAIDIAVYDENLMWATSGDNLLWKSTDRGVTWTSSNQTGTATAAGSNNTALIAIAPDDSDVLAFTDSANLKVWVSVNGGTSFGSLGIPQESGGNPASVLTDIAISADSSGINYVAVTGQEQSSTKANVWSYNVGAAAPAWTELNDKPGFDAETSGNRSSAVALAFSPNFPSDQVLAVVTAQYGTSSTTTETDEVLLELYSYNLSMWNSEAGFTSYEAAVLSDDGIDGVTKGSLTLAPDYNGSDDSLRTAFVGLTLSGDTAAIANNGIWRMLDTSAKGLKTGADYKIHSVGYDGTNLIAGRYDSNIVYRSADPTATTPTVSTATSLKRPGGTGNTTAAWAGADVVAITTGNESAFAVSRDNGKTFNDISLIDTSFSDLTDVAVSPDGSKVYLATDDGADFSLWRKASAWERVLSIQGMTNVAIRIAPDDPDVVYVVDLGAKSIYYTADAGETRWQTRTSRYDVADLAVETTGDVCYVLVSDDGTVSQSTNAGFTWGSAKDSLLTSSSTIISLGEDSVLVGSDNGYVSYSIEGGATGTWTKISKQVGDSSTPVLTAASGLADGDYIYAVLATAAKGIYRWQIGTSTVWKTIKSTMTGPARGIALEDGILYVSANTSTASEVYRTLSPTSSPTVYFSSLNSTAVFDATPKGLRVTSGSNKLWALNSETTETLYSYTDTLADVVPTLTVPLQDTIIKVNVVTGYARDVAFSWAKPSDEVTSYDLKIYDADGYAVKSITVASTLSAPSAVVGKDTDDTFAFMPGETYTWKVRVDATGPIYSNYSETRTFSVEEAEVTPPVIVTQYPPAPPAPPAPTPVITVQAPAPPNVTVQPPAVTVQPPAVTILPPAAEDTGVTPGWIYAIIVIGAVLVIAVIVLIVRTRRVV